MIQELADVGSLGEVGAELGPTLGDEGVQAVDNDLVCESFGLFHTKDVAEGVEEAVFLASRHDRGSLPRRVGGVRRGGVPAAARPSEGKGGGEILRCARNDMWGGRGGYTW